MAVAIDIRGQVAGAQQARSSTQQTRLGFLTEIARSMLTGLRIAGVYGGDKNAKGAVIHPGANRRPWKSYETVAADIAASLTRLGARHVELVPEDMNMMRRFASCGIDLAWLNTGGVQGHAPMSHAAALLEMTGIPYIGHNPLAAALLDDKSAFKTQLLGLGIPTAPFATWHHGDDLKAFVAGLPRMPFAGTDGAWVVKPVSGRASLHVNLVENRANLAAVIDHVHAATSNSVLVEAYLPGQEYCIAAAPGTRFRNGQLEACDGPFCFSAVERMLAPGERIFTSMDQRPISGDRIRVLSPQDEPETVAALERLGQAVFAGFNLGSLIRLDIRADSRGKLWVLEANPKPDLKAPEAGVTSIVTTGLEAEGMGYDDLIFSIFGARICALSARESDVMRRLAASAGCARNLEALEASGCHCPS